MDDIFEAFVKSVKKKIRIETATGLLGQANPQAIHIETGSLKRKKG